MNARNRSVSSSESIALADVNEFIAAYEASPRFGESEVRFSILRNFTVDGIDLFLKYRCYQAHVTPTISIGSYDTIIQEVMDKTSHVHASAPDVIILALLLETFAPDSTSPTWSADETQAELERLFSLIGTESQALVAVNTFIPPLHPESGLICRAGRRDKASEVAKLNQFIRSYVRERPDRFLLLDWERLALTLGAEGTFDSRFWFMYKSPFKKSFLDLYAQELAKIAKALRGMTKKCLVLDCDNTLWGGVLGEEGLHGIKLDRHTYPGNVFYAFQQNVLNLADRGVLLALCSKNNEDEVWEVLNQHPACLLKKKHLASWRVNWQDKATNISELARELNLGLDSFVFIDDNPTECDLVRTLLPEVTVLTVPQRLYTYPPILWEDGLFDAITASREDDQRSAMYGQERLRSLEQAKFDSMEQFLASLEISISVHEATAGELPRMAQLTQKTNQFNLTTKRYTEAQIQYFASDPSMAIISLGVQDRFGDSGLTGVLIARHIGESCLIDTFLLSCRVIGKSIEMAFLRRGLELLKARWGPVQFIGEYIPSRKNGQVAQFWNQAGFTECAHAAESDSRLYTTAPGYPGPSPISHIRVED